MQVAHRGIHRFKNAFIAIIVSFYIILFNDFLFFLFFVAVDWSALSADIRESTAKEEIIQS